MRGLTCKQAGILSTTLFGKVCPAARIPTRRKLSLTVRLSPDSPISPVAKLGVCLAGSLRLHDSVDGQRLVDFGNQLEHRQLDVRELELRQTTVSRLQLDDTQLQLSRAVTRRLVFAEVQRQLDGELTHTIFSELPRLAAISVWEIRCNVTSYHPTG